MSEQVVGADGRELGTRQVTQFEEQFQIFLGVALVLLLAEAVLPDRRRHTEAWEGRFS